MSRRSRACVDALGYDIDVGGTGLILGTSPTPIGDEVVQQLFHRADAGPVMLTPVARYSPMKRFRSVGTCRSLMEVLIGAWSAPSRSVRIQTLNPQLTPDSGSTFDPGAGAFGIYVHSNSFGRDSFTQDGRNTGPTSHACRVYPLKNRAGQPIPNSYLLAFEDAANGDYQDYVFVLSNAGP